ncbi:MAG TPA: hypothetical protein VK206_22725 [Anaerolineales bacterium]|nr:hypothetical protein [Anaerolineales bacterium]
MQDSPIRAIDPALYEIRLAGHLTERWIERFSSAAISYDQQGNTCLSGSFDQAALHGVLHKIRDLNLVILSVIRK